MVNIYVNGEWACQAPRADRQVWANTKVYAADPWYAAADASISGLYLLDHNSPPAGCLTATSGDTTTYDTIFDRPLGDDKSVVFTVRAANDAHLGFFSYSQSNGEVYEIVLSGWGNTMSTIRPCNQCTNSYQGSDANGGRRPTPGLLSGSEDRTFWGIRR